MKKLTYLAILLGLFTYCSEKWAPTEVMCSNEQMPEYDLRTFYVNAPDGRYYGDTTFINKTRDIFRPCRTYIYSASYWDSANNLIDESRVSITATGKRWEYQPEMQDDVLMQFQYDTSRIEFLSAYNPNKSLDTWEWQHSTRTGIVENEEQIWMHPFRSNHYCFTEVAPFPEVRLPLEVGKSWSGSLTIGQGWGDWENTTTNEHYQVMSVGPLKTKFRALDSCWHIHSRTIADFGNSTHDFWFSEEYGFVRMQYENYVGQLLVFELEDVVDK